MRNGGRSDERVAAAANDAMRRSPIIRSAPRNATRRGRPRCIGRRTRYSFPTATSGTSPGRGAEREARATGPRPTRRHDGSPHSPFPRLRAPFIAALALVPLAAFAQAPAPQAADRGAARGGRDVRCRRAVPRRRARQREGVAERPQRRDARAHARGHRHRHRPRRPHRHDRLPDRRGGRGQHHRPSGPRAAGDRRRLRPRDRLRPAALDRAARRRAGRAGKFRRPRRSRPRDDREPERQRRRGVRLGRVAASVLRQLGVHARAAALDEPADAHLERRRPLRSRREARRHRLAHRARRDAARNPACRATCSCRSTR